MAVSHKVCLDCAHEFMGRRDQSCPKCKSDQVMPVPEQPPPSKLIIEFAVPGSTEFNMTPEGIVTVGQLEALAHGLLAQAQYTRWAQIHQAAMAQAQAQEEEEQEPKIVVPGMHPAQVDDILRGLKE